MLDSPSVEAMTNEGGRDSGTLHEIFLGWADEVPESHIVSLRAMEGIDEWDLVR